MEEESEVSTSAHKSDFVGREKELSTLADILKEIKAGNGRTIMVRGEAGIGKTTFVERFADGNKDVDFFSSKCSHYEHPQPYRPFTEIADKLLRRERESHKQDIIETALQPVKRVRGVKPEIAKDNIYRAFLDVFQRNTSSSKPLLIFIDDLHWADTSSLHLFHYLARNVKKIPILLCGAYRLEYIDEDHPLNEVISRLRHERLIETLELKRLTKDDIDELAGDMTGRTDEIYRITEGNPLFVGEILETLDEMGDFSLPTSIKEMVMQRLTDLSVPAEKVLKMGAVIGAEFRGPLLQEVIGDIDIFLDGLDELIEKRIIREKRDQEEEIYEFDHKVIRQMVYENLTRSSRRVRHREIGKKLERYIHEDEEVVYDLSRHFYLGRVTDKSFEYSLKAAERSEEMYAHEETLKFYRYALDSGEKVKEEVKEDIGVDRTDILKALGDILKIIGEYDESIDYYQEGLKLTEGEEKAVFYGKMAEVLREKGSYERSLECCEKGLSLVGDKDVERDRLLNQKGWSVFRQGDYDKAIEIFKEEIELAKDLDVKDERAQSLHDLGSVYLRKGDYERAEDFLQSAIGLRNKINDSEGLSDSLNNLGIIYYNKGELDKALEYYERGLDIDEELGNIRGISSRLNNLGLIYRDKGELKKALDYTETSLDIKEEIGDKHGTVISLGNIGLLYHYRGELEKSLDHYERGLDVAKEIGDKHGAALSLNNIGNLYLSKENISKALDYYESCLDIAEDIGDKEGITMTLTGLAEAHIKKGNMGVAEEHAKKALQMALDMNAKMGEGISRRLLGMVYREQEDLEKAAKEFEKGMEVLESVGDREELSEVNYEYGLMYKAKGKKKKAKEHIEQAKSVFEDMGMKLWVEDCEEAIKELNDEDH